MKSTRSERPPEEGRSRQVFNAEWFHFAAIVTAAFD